MSTDVMTNPKTTTKEKKRISTKVIAQIGVLGAIAMVLMLFDIPLPFAPTFYKIDFSEVPVLIGAFTMGPVAGALIELVKILLNLLIRGTSTAGVGDLGNFLIGCAMCIPAKGRIFPPQPLFPFGRTLGFVYFLQKEKFTLFFLAEKKQI